MSLEMVLEAASAWANPQDPSGQALRERLRHTSSLSPAGIELALSQHLETEVSEAELARLKARAAPLAAPVVHVLLAGNVCVAAFRAIAFALACAPRIEVRPSRRDPALAQAIAEVCPAVTLVDRLQPAADHGVHLYGSDETLASMVLPGQALRFGSGFGVAVVERGQPIAGLAQDLVAFDGAGCISPRIIVAEDPETVLRALHEQLLEASVPRGELGARDRAALTRARSVFMAVGDWREGEHHALALDPAPERLQLPPPLRTAVIVPPQDIEDWLPREGITTIGGSGALSDRVGVWAPRARRSELGRMQRPPFDGPVDLRPLAGRDTGRGGS